VLGYRLYLFDGKRHGLRRVTRTIALAAETDAEALQQADDRRQGQYAELWRDDHLVRVFEPD
jgi:hypothetical protein